MAILPRADVRAALPEGNYTDDAIDSALAVVAGWLRNASRLTTLPDPIPLEHDLYAAAVELAIIRVTNPEGLARSIKGPNARWWSENHDRREQILAEIRQRYALAAMQPGGDFPCATRWPDPVWPWRTQTPPTYGRWL